MVYRNVAYKPSVRGNDYTGQQLRQRNRGRDSLIIDSVLLSLDDFRSTLNVRCSRLTLNRLESTGFHNRL